MQKAAWRLLLCSVVQRRLEGLGTMGGSRDIGGSSAVLCLGLTLSSAALGCVVVNWGNNPLLNKTDVFAFFPRKQRIS